VRGSERDELESNFPLEVFDKEITMSDAYYAPIIEYKGVCILEKRGHVRAVWNGQEYWTDGSVHLFAEGAPGTINILSVPTERDAKDLLDHALVGDRLLQLNPDTRLRLLSWEACVRLLCRDDSKQLRNALKREPCRRWDAVAQVFVREGDRPGFIRDGQHRHGDY
jgi:hypothetical protein